MTDKVQKIREEVVKKLEVMQYQVHRKDAYKELKGVLDYIDSLQEEPVSNDLEDYAKKESESFAEREYEIDYIDRNALAKGYYWGVKAGVQWQKEQKSAWSEDDEETMSGLLSFLLINTSDKLAKCGKWLKWLRSIKQRIGG